MSPSLSAGGLSGEVQISAHPSIRNHAPHLDERQGPRHVIDWRANVTRWRRTARAQKHKDRGRTREHAWTHRTSHCTLRAHLFSPHSRTERRDSLISVANLIRVCHGAGDRLPSKPLRLGIIFDYANTRHSIAEEDVLLSPSEGG